MANSFQCYSITRKAELINMNLCFALLKWTKFPENLYSFVTFGKNVVRCRFHSKINSLDSCINAILVCRFPFLLHNAKCLWVCSRSKTWKPFRDSRREIFNWIRHFWHVHVFGAVRKYEILMSYHVGTNIDFLSYILLWYSVFVCYVWVFLPLFWHQEKMVERRIIID